MWSRRIELTENSWKKQDLENTESLILVRMGELEYIYNVLINVAYKLNLKAMNDCAITAYIEFRAQRRCVCVCVHMYTCMYMRVYVYILCVYI